MLERLQPGDVVLVYKLDRIARSLKDLLTIIEHIEDSGAEFKSLTEIIDTTQPSGRMILQILGAFAEFEKELTRERTKAGLKAAKERGVRLGRERVLSDDEAAKIVALWSNGSFNKLQLSRKFNISRRTISRAIDRANREAQPELFAHVLAGD